MSVACGADSLWRMTSIAAARPRIVLADLVPGAWVRDAVLVLAGAGLTGLAAQVSVTISAISPVPFTLQTLAVLVTGAALGSVRGLLSIGLYAIAGIAGVPWYADHKVVGAARRSATFSGSCSQRVSSVNSHAAATTAR